MTIHFASYIEASAHQLREWAEGRPWHNPWAPGETAPNYSCEGGECCPDFSCCRPDLIWPREKRYAFVAAGEEKREHMLVGSLANLSDPDATYVAGGF